MACVGKRILGFRPFRIFVLWFLPLKCGTISRKLKSWNTIGLKMYLPETLNGLKKSENNKILNLKKTWKFKVQYSWNLTPAILGKIHSYSLQWVVRCTTKVLATRMVMINIWVYRGGCSKQCWNIGHQLKTGSEVVKIKTHWIRTKSTQRSRMLCSG